MKKNAFHFHLSLSLFFQFEKEFTDHQETQAQLQKKEEKINELQTELQAFKSQVKYRLPTVNLGFESIPGDGRSCQIFVASSCLNLNCTCMFL